MIHWVGTVLCVQLQDCWCTGLRCAAPEAGTFMSAKGRVALVTGAAGGIGSAWCRMLLDDGASLAFVDVDGVRLESARWSLRVKYPGSKLLPLQADLSDPQACTAVVAEVVETLGSVDILINNAALGMGIIRADHLTNLVGIDEVTPAHWRAMLDVNLMAAWYLTKQVVPFMKKQGWGRIITVTTSFFTMLRGRMHPYGPIKAALEAMTAGHAEEFDGTGITVNVVVPGGPTDTAMVTSVDYPDRSQLISPDAMTRPARWLCSRAADEVTRADQQRTATKYMHRMLHNSAPLYSGLTASSQI